MAAAAPDYEQIFTEAVATELPYDQLGDLPYVFTIRIVDKPPVFLLARFDVMLQRLACFPGDGFFVDVVGVTAIRHGLIAQLFELLPHVILDAPAHYGRAFFASRSQSEWLIDDFPRCDFAKAEPYVPRAATLASIIRRLIVHTPELFPNEGTLSPLLIGIPEYERELRRTYHLTRTRRCIYNALQHRSTKTPTDNAQAPSFLETPNADVACALIRMNCILLHSLSVPAIVCQVGLTQEQRPSIKPMVDFYNGLAGWVKGTVLSYDRVKERLAVMLKFIELGEMLRDARAGDALSGLVSGMSDTSLLRLKHTWGDMKSKDMARGEALSAIMSPDRGYRKMRDFVKDLVTQPAWQGGPRRACGKIKITKSKANCDPLSTLPIEVFDKVLSFLPVQDLAACGCVSRAWRDAASADALWRDVLRGMVGAPTPTALERVPGGEEVNSYAALEESIAAAQGCMTAREMVFAHRWCLSARGAPLCGMMLTDMHFLNEGNRGPPGEKQIGVDKISRMVACANDLIIAREVSSAAAHGCWCLAVARECNHDARADLWVRQWMVEHAGLTDDAAHARSRVLDPPGVG